MHAYHLDTEYVLSGKIRNTFHQLGKTNTIKKCSSSIAVSSHAAAATKSLQSCPILRPHREQPTRLLQARVLEWGAIERAIESLKSEQKFLNCDSLSCLRG